MEKIEDKEVFDFLKAIHGDDIPENLKRKTLPCGSVVYSVGEPDIKKIIKMTLALMG